MATFKDIARLAGVSYGTVSNVLNGRGNVSSDKIQRVRQAADQLGYTPNQGAQVLRKGNSNLLAVVMPGIGDQQYADFYISFRNYAEAAGYRTALYLHDGSAAREAELAVTIRSELAAGIVSISAASPEHDPYQQAGFTGDEVLLAEQRPFSRYDYVGFDYQQIGRAMGRRTAGYRHIALMTEGADSYVTKQLLIGFTAEAQKTGCQCQHYKKENTARIADLALDILSADVFPEAVFCVNWNHATALRNIHGSFFAEKKLDIYTMSPLFTLPENDYQKYELNYRLMGKTAAERLIGRISGSADAAPQSTLLAGDGFRRWAPDPIPEPGSLTMLTLDSPTAQIMKNMARMYTRYTGVPVHVTVFPYDGVHEILTGMGEETPFDIIRLDATWMNWFAPRVFEPLSNLDPQADALRSRFLPGLMERYGGPGDSLYALPETPSAQMLFYRRDLFEDISLQRLYKEQNHEQLRPPADYAQYNRIARFFTRQFNASSPVRYGSTLTLGNTGVAATEFLTRYFSLDHDLFSPDDGILLDSPAGRQALAGLVESRAYSNPQHSVWWRDTARTFAQGEAAMTVLYSNYASEMTGPGSRLQGKIGFSMVPGGNPLFGGGSIGVCRFSKKKALAYHFIKWLCGEEVSTAMTLLGSVSPCSSAYDNYQVIDTYPWLSMSRACFEKSDAHRLPHAAVQFDERRFLSILGIQVINAINGTCGVAEALKRASDQYAASMG
ncbi:MAG: extracellular solute-binding protein [Clostridia bacterium]|nr:extracellular solute-binding protein [Clostridia bacterium]